MSTYAKSFSKLRLGTYFLLCLLTSSACSNPPSVGRNYALMITGTTLFAYPGETITPSPQFTVFELSSKLIPYSDFGDSMSLSPFTDSKCTTAADGTITSASSPVSLTAGVATFSDASFSWKSSSTSAWKEGKLYLKGTLTSAGTGYCSNAISMIQHFNLGFGYVVSGPSGAAGTSTASTVYDSARAIRVEADGRYIIAGISKNTSGGQEIALWKYFPTGKIDTTFGTNGIVHSGTTGISGATGASESDTVVDLQIDSDGNYILGGSSVNASGGTEAFITKRLATDGAIDTTFGTSGIVASGSTGASGLTGAATVLDTVNSLKIDSNKLIVAVGSSKNSDGGTELSIRRLTAAGVLDSTFASSGVYHSGTTGAAGATGAAVSDIGNSLQVDSQGKYVIAGSSVNTAGKKEMAIWRFNSDGTPDTSWGTQGVIHFGTTGVAGGTDTNLEDIGRALLIDSKNRYVVVGSSKNSSGGTELAIWRYLDTGTLDTSFNSSGSLHYGTTGVAGATAAQTYDMGLTVGEDSSSNYVITGTSLNTSLGRELTIWKYKPEGQLDTSFNSVGTLHYGTTGTSGATGAYVGDIPYAAIVDSVGTYTIVGQSQNTDTGSNGKEFAIWRYLNLGTLDI